MPVFPDPHTLFELLTHSASLRPGHIALVSRDEKSFGTLTYSELREAAIRFATWAHDECSAVSGDDIVILARSSAEWVVGAFGISALGATIVPLSPQVSQEQLRMVLANVRPRLILADWGETLKVQALLDALEQNAQIIELDSLPEILSSVTPATPEQLAEWEVAPSSTAAVFWTSGTSGELKGVVLTHENLCSNVRAFARAVPLGESDALYSMLPLSHIFEFSVGMLAPLHQGAQITYASPDEDPFEAFFDVAPSTLLGVPRLLEKLIAWGEVRLDGLSPLGLVISGGAALPISLAQRFMALDVTILQGYGLTETGPVISVNRRLDNKIGTVGLPLDHVQVRLSPKGELQTRGPSVSPRYFSALWSHERRDEEGWFSTGDVASIDNEGYITIIGRIDDIIMLSTGDKIAPLAIEERLERCPFIAQAMTVGEGRKHVAAIITLSDPSFMMHQGAASQLREEIERALHDLPGNHQVRTYLILSHPFTIEAGELTPTMKLRRAFIAQKYSQQINDLYNRT